MQTNMRVFDAASPEAPGNRRKWNSILKATSEREERTDNAPNEPEIQSNQRLRVTWTFVYFLLIFRVNLFQR